MYKLATTRELVGGSPAFVKQVTMAFSPYARNHFRPSNGNISVIQKTKTIGDNSQLLKQKTDENSLRNAMVS